MEPAKPAVSVKKSMTPEYLVCLEDGKRFKSLKRHLRTQYNMTPEQYRDKWGLPADYPMVAPNYARWRVRSSPRKWASASSAAGAKVAIRSALFANATKRASGVGAMRSTIGAQAVGALRRQVVAKSELVEHGERVGCEESRCGVSLAGIEREQDRDQPAHDMGVAVADDSSAPALAVRLRSSHTWLASQTWLAQPCTLLSSHSSSRSNAIGLRHRRQRAAEFDDVPVAVVPILQQLEIIPDFVDDEVIDHLGAGLGALADRDRRLGADHAGLRLAVAETAHVGNRRARGDHRFGGPTLACALCCAPPLGSSASTMVSQNATQQKEHVVSPVSLSNSFRRRLRTPWSGCCHDAA
jgi:hypothetical protein